MRRRFTGDAPVGRPGTFDQLNGVGRVADVRWFLEPGHDPPGHDSGHDSLRNPFHRGPLIDRGVVGLGFSAVCGHDHAGRDELAQRGTHGACQPDDPVRTPGSDLGPTPR
ncbi:MAG: hypothetical protein H0W07_01840 [Chloroflexi bacterium]|nr:hypothetical protein [Chloroflexota bacterium]